MLSRRMDSFAVIILALGFVCSLPVAASPEDALLSKANVSKLEPIRKVLQYSSPVLTDSARKSIGYGILVSESGHVLTKASLLKDLSSYFLRLDRNEYVAELVTQSKEWDVALLKIDHTGGVPIKFSSKPPQLGDLIVVNGVTSLLKRRLKFGVVSANDREIPMQGATLDFLAVYNDDGVFEVTDVKSDGEAAAVGMKLGDLVHSIDGVKVEGENPDFSKFFVGKWPGDIAEVEVYRNGDLLSFSISYQWEYMVFPNPMDRNDAMSGRVSNRRTGFPSVIQHDVALTRRTVGGPLLDLNGYCLGMNIARYSRAETYAIPAFALQNLINEWIK